MASGVGVTYELEFVIKDKGVQKYIQSMQKEAEKLAKTLDKITLDNFSKHIQQAKNTMEQLNKVKENVGKAVSNPLNNVEKGAERAKLALEKVKKLKENIVSGTMGMTKNFLMNAGSEALQQYGQTDYELRGAAAKTGGYGVDLKAYRALSQKVGGDTKFNNLDVAKAINAGATLGIKKDEMKSIIPAAASLAQAFNSEIPMALEMTKMHMNAYGIASKDATKVTDMIAVTAQNSAADLTRLAEGFKYAAPSAKALNVPIESVYAMLGKLNDKGLIGSTAGTGLNQMFEAFKDFKKRGKIEELIGPITDSKGNLQDVTSILKRLKDTTDKMGTADKAGVLKTIFGVQGGRAVNSLLNSSIEDLEKFQEQIKNSSGSAAKLSKFMMMGSAGAVETFMGTLSSVFMKIFDSLEPLLVPIAGAFMVIADVIGLIAEKAPWLLQLVSIFTALLVGVSVFKILKESIGSYLLGIKEAIIQTKIWKLALMGGLAIAIMIIFNYFHKWQEYLQQNADVNKVWEVTLESLNVALGAIGDLIWSILGALFGFNTNTEKATDNTKFLGMSSDEVKRKLEIFKSKIEDFTKKVKDMAKWVSENKDKVKAWGEAFKVIAIGVGILYALSAAQTAFNVVAASNPYVLIAMAIIGAIMLIWFTLNWFYNNVTWFRDGVNAVWDFIKEHWVTILQYLGGLLLGGPIGIALVWLYNNVTWFKDGVNMAWDFIKEHWQTAIGFIVGLLLGGPIGMAIGFIAGLIVELYQKNETFRNIVNSVWSAVSSAIGTAVSEAIGHIKGLIGALSQAGEAMKSLLNGDFKGALSHGGNIVNKYKNAVQVQRMKHNMKGNIPPAGTMATGTDNFMLGRTNNMTTTDEHGDEAIWLPNGSMIARNTTTRDILQNMKAIKNNTRGNNNVGQTVITNNNHFVINVKGGEQVAHEIMRELENLGIS